MLSIKTHIKNVLRPIKRKVFDVDPTTRWTQYSAEDFWSRYRLCQSAEVSQTDQAPKLNLVLPTVRMKSMSGGPNTALQFCLRLHEKGIPLRILSLNTEVESNHEKLYLHFESLLGRPVERGSIEFLNYGFGHSVTLGSRDMYVATSWWTAQAIWESVAPEERLIYFIQDYEPGFYGWGTLRGLAEETYKKPHFPVVNSKMLYDHLIGEDELNSLWEPCFFQPALDRSHFYPEERKRAKRTLLFYARPKMGERNLYEMGLEALFRWSESSEFKAANWQLFFIGEPIPNVRFENGVEIRCLPWKDYEAYAEMIRQSDLVMSLMMSPHPSYTPLEAAATGSQVVTTAYASKTPDELQKLSSNLIGCVPTVTALTQGLLTASRNVEAGANDQVRLPSSWDEAMGECLNRVFDLLKSKGLGVRND